MARSLADFDRFAFPMQSPSLSEYYRVFLVVGFKHVGYAYTHLLEPRILVLPEALILDPAPIAHFIHDRIVDREATGHSPALSISSSRSWYSTSGIVFLT
jgi:hypothetical protein